MTIDVLDGVREGRLERPDGRTVAWTECGEPTGTPLLRVPGTPGSRYGIRGDRSPWEQRNLWAITTERPGYGASTRLPGRRFAEHSDDLAAILDHLGVESLHVIGGSGSAPHQLAFAAHHPDRVRAMTVLVGAAPINDDEIDTMIGLNATSQRLIRTGDVTGMRKLLDEQREAILADPLGAFEQLMDKAPEADRAIMSDPLWRAQLAVSVREALAQGVDGWLDECYALTGDWTDIDLSAVRTSVTWWHAAGDANAPLTAAQRLVAQLPNARMVLFAEDEGHLAGYHREGEILDELLSR